MKNSILVALFALVTMTSCAQQKEYQLSTHILDISEGLPAESVTIKLEKKEASGDSWQLVSEKTTNEKGRVSDFLPKENSNNGIYKLTFFTKEYFKTQQKESFYPYIEVVFEITANEHYHVPITLSAFGYSTYRGS